MNQIKNADSATYQPTTQTMNICNITGLYRHAIVFTLYTQHNIVVPTRKKAKKNTTHNKTHNSHTHTATASYCLLPFRNYSRTSDTELNRLLLSSYFDKSHLELWRKKQVLIQRAPNLSQCLKSWKKIFDQGGYSILFSPSTHRIKPVFFSPAKSEWWQLSRRWDLWQKFSRSTP